MSDTQWYLFLTFLSMQQREGFYLSSDRKPEYHHPFCTNEGFNSLKAGGSESVDSVGPPPPEKKVKG